MDKKRLRKLAGLGETEEEILSEGGFDVRPQVGPNYQTTVWRKQFGKGAKPDFQVKFNFSSFSLARDFIPRDAPSATDLRQEWEDKQARDLSKKATPLIRKFVSDLNKLLKAVK